MFQYSFTERTVPVPVSRSWKTVPAVPVPRSVPAKTVPTVPVSGSSSVPGPPCKNGSKNAKTGSEKRPETSSKFLQRVQVSLSGYHFLLCSWGTPLAQRKRHSVASRGVPRGFPGK